MRPPPAGFLTSGALVAFIVPLLAAATVTAGVPPTAPALHFPWARPIRVDRARVSGFSLVNALPYVHLVPTQITRRWRIQRCGKLPSTMQGKDPNTIGNNRPGADADASNQLSGAQGVYRGIEILPTYVRLTNLTNLTNIATLTP